jgi:hypothetical protein
MSFSPVVIRSARGSDAPALRRLAELDSAAVPSGDVLVAETAVGMVAAHAPATGATVADPFLPTAEVVRLLELRGTMLLAA